MEEFEKKYFKAKIQTELEKFSVNMHIQSNLLNDKIKVVKCT